MLNITIKTKKDLVLLCHKKFSVSVTIDLRLSFGSLWEMNEPRFKHLMKVEQYDFEYKFIRPILISCDKKFDLRILNIFYLTIIK